MKKVNTICIATDYNGVERISAGKDARLASARWHSTSHVCIYRQPGGLYWYGSCRMNRKARKDFYKAGIHLCIDRQLNTSQAISMFANKIAEYCSLLSEKVCLPSKEDVLVGTDQDENLIVLYKGFYARLDEISRLPLAKKNKSRRHRLLALWSYNASPSFFSFDCSSRSEADVINSIVQKIDEVTSSRRKPNKSKNRY